MRVELAKKAIMANMKVGRPTFLWGAPGNAKTQMPKQLAGELGYGYICMYLGQNADVADILGLMKHNEDGTFTHSKPSWFPKEGKHIIHLDELNRCHPDLIQSMYSFLQTGKFGPHQLPEGCYIIGSGNPDNENHQVTNIDDDAFMSRFQHITVELEFPEWVKYAKTKGLHENVANFLAENPEFLGSKPVASLKDKIKPNPRTWLESISKLEYDDSIDEIRYEMYSGDIGTTSAARFLAWKRDKKDDRIKTEDILENYTNFRNKVLMIVSEENVRLDKLNMVTEEILSLMESNDKSIGSAQVENFKTFLMDIPLELAFKVSQKLSSSKFKLKNSIVNDPEFLKLFAAAKNLKPGSGSDKT